MSTRIRVQSIGYVGLRSMAAGHLVLFGTNHKPTTTAPYVSLSSSYHHPSFSSPVFPVLHFQRPQSTVICKTNHSQTAMCKILVASWK